MNSNGSYNSGTLNSYQNQQFFVPGDLEIWQMTLKNNRAPLLTYFKLCASFRSHCWIQTGVTVQKRPIWFKIGVFLSPVTLKFDWWPWKILGHLFYATSSCVHHLVAICEFKLELWSGKAQIGAKFALTSVTLTFDLWPWPFAWTLLLSMLINFMMINDGNIGEKGVTDRQTDRQTDWTIHKSCLVAAKNSICKH